MTWRNVLQALTQCISCDQLPTPILIIDGIYSVDGFLADHFEYIGASSIPTRRACRRRATVPTIDQWAGFSPRSEQAHQRRSWIWKVRCVLPQVYSAPPSATSDHNIRLTGCTRLVRKNHKQKPFPGSVRCRQVERLHQWHIYRRWLQLYYEKKYFDILTDGLMFLHYI